MTTPNIKLLQESMKLARETRKAEADKYAAELVTRAISDARNLAAQGAGSAHVTFNFKPNDFGVEYYVADQIAKELEAYGFRTTVPAFGSNFGQVTYIWEGE